jgi:large subunit ribosomal protein L24
MSAGKGVRSRGRHQARVRRGDTVMVISGDDKGKTGRVLRVILNKDRVVVENVNLVYRHVRRSQQSPQGGRVRREAPIHVSNVMVVSGDDDAPTKIGRRLVSPEKGSLGWVRFARKTGDEVVVGAGGKAAKKVKKSKKAKE